MTVVQKLGQQLFAGVFYLKYNSQQDFSVFIWDDTDATLPANLGSTAVTLEIDQPTVAGTVFTGTVVSTTNEVQFSLSSVQTSVTWDRSNFRLVYVNSGKRYVILSGEVRVQR
jgi:hypothetical protein